jgi:hypothetical protein
VANWLVGNLETLFLEAGLEVILNEESGRNNQKRATFIQRKLIESYESEIIKRFGQEFYNKLHAKYLLDAVTQKKLKEDREEAKSKKQEERTKLKQESIKLRKKELAIRNANRELRDEKFDVVREENTEAEARIKTYQLKQERQKLDDAAYKIRQKINELKNVEYKLQEQLGNEQPVINPDPNSFYAIYKKMLEQASMPEARTKRQEEIIKLDMELKEINAKLAAIK